MTHHKFDPKKLEKLNNPKRVESLNLELLIKELNIPSNSTLVDIGAGTGVFSEELLKLIPDSKCYAYDISNDMITWINENRVPNLNSRLFVSLMEENKIPANDNFADLAFMINLHHELENSDILTKEVYRIIKTNGKILICDWKEGAHHHFVKKDVIINDLKNAGFENIKEIDASENLVCIIATKTK
ncbi:MAG: class I SAM-dependent methyltransferase [Sarcina sp.]